MLMAFVSSYFFEKMWKEEHYLYHKGMNGFVSSQSVRTEIDTLDFQAPVLPYI